MMTQDYICPLHPELGWLDAKYLRSPFDKHVEDGMHPAEMNVRTRREDGSLAWTQWIRFAGPAPTTQDGWSSMMRGIFGR